MEKIMKNTLALLHKPKEFKIIEEEIPKLKENQVLIKVLSCGVCATELSIFDGKNIDTPGTSFRYKSYPARLGHEVVGYVEKVGENVLNFEIGDCVTGLTYSGCGFAKYFVEDSEFLIKVPIKDNKKHYLCFAEPLMATTNLVNQINPEFGDSVCIVGDGYMSLLLISSLSKFPLKNLIVVGHHDNRLSLAKKYGATQIINSKNEDAWKNIMDLTSNEGVDVSVEYAGSSESMQLSASICKPKQRAKLALASSYSVDTPFIISNYLQNRAPILIPSYPNQSKNKIKDLERSIWGLSQNIFSLNELITHKYSLNNIAEAFYDCQNKKSEYIKGIVFP